MANSNFATEKEEALKYIIDTVTSKCTHEDYKRVVSLADRYKKLITGEKIDELLRQFVRREDAELFEQRKTLTQAITPAVSESIMNPFYKVGRVNPVANKITLSEKKEDAPEDLQLAIKEYNGDKSVGDYLESRFVDLSFTDPNAFIVTEFDQVPVGAKGEMTGKVKPRPFEVSSEEAVNYFYKNAILQWLIVKLEYEFEQGEDEVKEVEGHSYTIYMPNIQIKFTPVNAMDKKYSLITEGKLTETTDGNSITVFYRVSEKELYIVDYFEHKAGRVQAFRVGYKRDLVTSGRTYVNPMHAAMPYFMKSIKTVSEFDLTMALHAFPQKFQYVNRCTAEGCDGGLRPDGGNCGTCKGSGWAVHTSAQDGVFLRLPKNKEEIFPLEQMVHYERPPVDILEFQNKFIIQTKNDCRQAVFNSETFTKNEIQKTAFEAAISMDSVYDTLFPFANQYTKAYKYIVTLIASFVDYPKVTVEYRLPKDFKFKTVDDLLGELKIANESNAPGYIRQEISSDISEQLFVDKPNELKRVRIKERFNPFPGKLPTEIVFIISNGLTTEYNKVLWANFDSIFASLESDSLTKGVNFYDLEFSKQQEAIDAEVDSLITEIKGDQPEPAVSFTDPNNVDANPAP